MVVVMVEVRDPIGVLMTPFIYFLCTIEQVIASTKKASSPRVGAAVLLCDDSPTGACSRECGGSCYRHLDGT